MANPNGLIRPPVLGTPPPNPSPMPAQPSISAQAPNTPNAAELTALITNIVSQVLSSQTKSLVQSYLNPNSELVTATDQTIEERHRNNLADLDKVPDVVRCLREFSGKPGEFSSWKKSVERVLQIYEPM